MNVITGRSIEGIDHLRQSIADILSTPLGSRLMRRAYGSESANLVDFPLNEKTRVRLFGATAGALMKWEPRLRITRIGMDLGDASGQVSIIVEGTYVPDGGAAQPVALSVPLQ